jgi:hyperosmotically inducible periplasmic protein
MNTKAFALAALLAISALDLAGCASTRTQESAGEYTSDSVITTKVKTALLADAKLKSYDISVKTYRGQVELSGFVDSVNQISRAIVVARGVDGVGGVTNALQIKSQ